MGQSASKSALKRESRRELNESKRELIYRAEVWMGIKTLEVEALQKSTFDAQKDIDKIRRQFLCQSILLKEAFDDQLRQQKHETEAVKRELAELKQRMQRLEFVFASSAALTPQPLSTSSVTTVVTDNIEHFV
jgi:predicted  nucleic acid-binding Zn-ribbon protein